MGGDVMRSKLLALSVVSLLWVAPSSAEHQHGYVWRTFDVPGAESTTVASVNVRGDIAGSYVSGGVTHGFIAQRGRVTTIDAPVAGTFLTMVWRVSPTGTALGFFRTAGSCPTCPPWLQDFRMYGFTWNRGHFQVVNMPGTAYAIASGINTRGDIVGECWNGKVSGFLLRKGQFSTIDVSADPDDPLSWSAAMDVNARGDVVGWRGDGASFTFSAYLLRRGRLTSIDIPGYTWTVASAINDRDEVILNGSANWTIMQSFIWRDGEMTEVQYPGAQRTAVYDIDDSGDLAGVYEDIEGHVHGFIAWKKGRRR
jgi:hypothetical protein